MQTQSVETFESWSTPVQNRLGSKWASSRILPRDMAFAQGMIYIASGLWPVFSIRTFEKVTGPKTDDWLVKTVGLLIAATGGILVKSAFRNRVPKELSNIAAAQALCLAGVSTFYSLKGTISKIYLLDMLLELALVAGWQKSKTQ